MTNDDFLYKADATAFKNPVGAVVAGQRVTFSVRLSRRQYAYNVFLVTSGIDVAKHKMVWKEYDCGFDIYRADIILSNIGLMHYHFEIDLFGEYRRIGRGKKLTACIDGVKDFTLLVYHAFQTPDWIKGGIMYQLFIDRFSRGEETPFKPYAKVHKNLHEMPLSSPDSNGFYNYDFYGGNLSGITQKLPYLKSLGVKCILLSPFCEAFSNHKYDTGDYEKLDVMFGTEKTLSELVEKARNLEISILMDGVYNHTGSDSRYFDRYSNYGGGAYCDKTSPFYEWYSFKKMPEQYESWWGVSSLPAVKKDSVSFQNFIAGKNGILEKWLSLGIRGVRLDVADELRNTFLKKIRLCCEKNCDSPFIIGEVWEDAVEKTAYGELKEYFWGHELDSVIHYPFKEAVTEYILSKNSEILSETLLLFWDKYPKNVCHCLMNVLDSHDTARILTVLSGVNPFSEKSEPELSPSGYAIAVKRMRIATLLQFTVYGVPCIYYGDERGMTGGADPFNRKPVIWEECDEVLLRWYKILAKIRTKEVFCQGEFKELYSGGGVYIYERFNNEESVIVGVNVSDSRFYFRADGYESIFKKKKNGIFCIKNENCIVLSKKLA